MLSLTEREEIVDGGKSRKNCWEKKITEKQERDNMCAEDPMILFLIQLGYLNNKLHPKNGKKWAT